MTIRYMFRLKPGRDDELIQWLESLGKGERSCFIRKALREAVERKPAETTKVKQTVKAAKPKHNKVILTSSPLNTDLKSKVDKLTCSF